MEVRHFFKDVKKFTQAVTKYAVRRSVQVEKWVNEPKKVRVRCKDGCPWLFYGCIDNRTNNFMIKIKIQSILATTQLEITYAMQCFYLKPSEKE